MRRGGARPRAVGPVEQPSPCVRSEAWRAETAAGKKGFVRAPDFPETLRRGQPLDSKGRSLWLILCLLSVQRQKVGRRRPLPQINAFDIGHWRGMTLAIGRLGRSVAGPYNFLQIPNFLGFFFRRNEVY